MRKLPNSFATKPYETPVGRGSNPAEIYDVQTKSGNAYPITAESI
jgi:hypothetical protein